VVAGFVLVIPGGLVAAYVSAGAFVSLNESAMTYRMV
jgi:hypothetical protein